MSANPLISTAKALLSNEALTYDARNDAILALIAFCAVLEKESEVADAASKEWHSSWRAAKIALSQSERLREAAERARDEVNTALSLVTRELDEAKQTIARLDSDLDKATKDLDKNVDAVAAQKQILVRVQTLYNTAKASPEAEKASWVAFVGEALGLPGVTAGGSLTEAPARRLEVVPPVPSVASNGASAAHS